MGARKRDRSVQCWPDGHAGRPCENAIPDTESATMAMYGWGFVLTRDAGSGSGEGFFYACPWHRDDLKGDTERRTAIALYCKAVGKTEEELS